MHRQIQFSEDFLGKMAFRGIGHDILLSSCHWKSRGVPVLSRVFLGGAFLWSSCGRLVWSRLVLRVPVSSCILSFSSLNYVYPACAQSSAADCEERVHCCCCRVLIAVKIWVDSRLIPPVRVGASADNDYDGCFLDEVWGVISYIPAVDSQIFWMFSGFWLSQTSTAGHCRQTEPILPPQAHNSNRPQKRCHQWNSECFFVS